MPVAPKNIIEEETGARKIFYVNFEQIWIIIQIFSDVS